MIEQTSLQRTIFAALTFHINWLEAKVGYLLGPWDVLWSLSVEEVFYLAFPLLCLFLKNRRLFVLILILLIIVGPFARTLSTNEIWQDHGYLSCMDGIAFGVLAAMFVSRKSDLNTKLFLLAGLCLFSLIFFFRHFTFLLGLTKIGLNVTLLESGMALILITLSANPHKFKGAGVFCWYGRNSYEVYLTHGLIITVIAETFRNINHPWIWYGLAILASGLIGAGVAKYYSEPLNHWIRHVRN